MDNTIATSNIASDGDLGELGRDILGSAADGVSDAGVQAVRAAMNELDERLATHAAAVNSAEAAVSLQESWVELGKQVLALTKGITDKVMAAHPATGPSAPKEPLVQRILDLSHQIFAFGLPHDPRVL